MDLKADRNEAPQAQDSEALTVDGCVCPQCFKPLKAPAVTVSRRDRYGIRLRDYNGFCFHCRQGCRVLQFERDGKWLLHSYLHHRYESGQFVACGDWIQVNPLLEPPAVLTGPGGDYDTVPDLSDDLIMPLLRSASCMMLKVSHTIRELLEVIEKLRRNEPDNRKH